MKIPALKKASLLLAVPALTLLSGCEKANEFIEPPPPPVTVAQPIQRDVTEFLEFTGVTRAVNRVEIRARVPGFLQSIEYEPGKDVEKGQLLFVIDPREYQAELEAAKAELESAKAQYERAEIEFGRAERLFKQKAGSEADVVKWRGERNVAQAAIARAEAKVDRARLNLGYTEVTAPISGRADRNLVDVGNLVGEGEPTLLTNVTALRPMYVYFNLNERDLLRAMELYRARIERAYDDSDPSRVSEIEAAEIPLYLGLANEEGFPHEGVADYADSSVDPGTGTIQLRGVFANEGKVMPLLPGLFARVRMPIKQRKDALLVSDRAIGSDQGGSYLLVVNSDNVVEKHPIKLGQLDQGMRVIDEGLEPGDRVIINGLQRARPGGKVNPTQTEMAKVTKSSGDEKTKLEDKQDEDKQVENKPSEETQASAAQSQAEPADVSTQTTAVEQTAASDEPAAEPGLSSAAGGTATVSANPATPGEQTNKP